MRKLRWLIIFLSLSCLCFAPTFIVHATTITEQQPITIEEFQVSEAGTYPVIIEYQDEKTSEKFEKIVTMTVYYPNTITNIHTGEGIDAMDVLLNDSEILQMTSSELIDKAKARAWNIADGSSVEITEAVVNFISQNEQHGHYNVTFKTARGTENTVTFLALMTPEILPLDEVYLEDFTQLDNQITDWIYVTILAFILIPIIIISFSLLRMITLVKKARKLLYQEYYSK